MQTRDHEFVSAGADYRRRQPAAGQAFFVWVNTPHMHFRTHTKPASVGRAGRWQSPYHYTMPDHDDNVGALLDLVDELGIGDNTIVRYSTDKRTAYELLARWRHDSVSEREEFELGGRLP